MKKKHRFLVILVLALSFFIALVWFQSHRLLKSPKVQEALIQKIQAITEGTLHYQGLETGLFPQPSVTLIRPKLDLSNDSLTLEAEKIRFEFNILPIALGRVEPSSTYMTGGKIDTGLPWFPFLGELAFRNLDFKMGAIRPNLAIPIQIESDIGDKKHAIFVKGHFVAPSVERPEWDQISSNFQVELKDLPLEGAKEANHGSSSFVFFNGGSLSGHVEINKKKSDPFLELSANGRMEGIHYEVKQDEVWVTPPAVDADWNFSGAWSAATEELKIQKMTTTLPFGGLEMNGSVQLSTGEISKLHFIASDMVLEDLLKYWPQFEDVLPLHIGFSGPMDWVLSLEGTLDHLSIHLNLDLNQTLLSYGAYFTKAKDVPLSATFDLLAQKGETLSGDFSIRFQEMSLKGNLTSLDLTTGVGQLNLLTNKFSLKGCEQYIPVFQKYELNGDAKILANWKGDLRHLEESEQIFNVTVEKGNWTDTEGKGITNANLSFDYSPLMFESREMRFDLGGSPILGDLKVTDLSGYPEIQIKVASGELRTVQTWEAVMALFQPRKEQATKDIYDHVKDSIVELFPNGQMLKDFSTEVHYLEGIWDVRKLHASIYNGTLDATGSLDLLVQPVAYQCEGDVKGMDFGSFLARGGGEQKAFEGALFLKADLEGTGWGAEAWGGFLKGHGRFTLVDGKSEVLEVAKPISTIAPFSEIQEKVGKLDTFEQLDFSWSLEYGKISTGDFLIKDKTRIIDGEGTIDFDEIANFRFDVFLPTSIAAELLPDMASALLNKPKAHLGPIPILLSGLITSPELKPDPAQVGELVTRIESRKTKDLLYELVLD